MVLAVLSMAVAFVVGLTFLATSSTSIETSRVLAEHARARQIADSGIAVARSCIEQNPSWRSEQASGPWIQDLPFLGGTLTLDAAFAPETPVAALTPQAPGFEGTTGELATPLLDPPMSGVIGGWSLERTALLPTGPTVPTIGMEASANATEGGNAAFVSFGLSVTGSGTISQTVGASLAPRTTYELKVDVAAATGLPQLTHGLRVLAGGAVVAASEQAWSFALPTDPGELPQLPQSPTSPEQYQALLTYAGLGPGAPVAYTLTFVTDSDPPAGSISIQLWAEATGVLGSVWFDNVRLTSRRNDPVSLTAVGRFGDASHVIEAQVASAFDGSARVVDWSEP